MKTFLLAFVIALAAAFSFQLAGVWWAMPVAGALGGWWLKKGGPGSWSGR